MPQSVLNVMVTADHPVPIEPLSGTATVTNVSGDTLYCADNPQVSASNNQGSIAAGNSQTFTGQIWIRSASLSSVQISLVVPNVQAKIRLDARDYGVVADCVTRTDAQILAGGNQLSCAGYNFRSSDAGKLVSVVGAGAPNSTGALSGPLSTGTPISAIPVNALTTAIPPGGVTITSPSQGTTSANLSTAANITSIPVNALPQSVNSGPITLVSGIYTQTFTTTGAAQNATSIPVTSLKPNFPFPAGTQIVYAVQNMQTSGAPATATSVPLAGQFIAQISAALSTGGPITSLPIPALPANIGALTLTLSSPDGTMSQSFTGSSANATATSITVSSVTPLYNFPQGSVITAPPTTVTPVFNFPSGSTVSSPIPALSTTIQSASAGVATLAASATNPVVAGEVSFATDDTAAWQTALNAAAAVPGGVLEGPYTPSGISSALSATGAFTLLGQGFHELYGTAASGSVGNIPEQAPYLTGSVLVQFAANTDILQRNGNAVSQHVRHMGLRFAGRFVNTGHGLNTTSLPAAGGALDSGPMGSVLRDVAVFGHDGNHYGFNNLNEMLPRFDYLRSWGGGGFHFSNNSTITFYGNLTSTRSYACVCAAGIAHGHLIDNVPGTNGTLDFLRWDHPQVWIYNVPALVFPGLIAPQANSTQQWIAANGYHTHVMWGPPLDWESNIAGLRITYPYGLGCSRYGDTGQGALINGQMGKFTATGQNNQNLMGVATQVSISLMLNPAASATASTTLNGASGISTTITVVSSTGFAIGDGIQIDSGTNLEFRTIQAVAGNVLTLTEETFINHSSGVAVQNGAAVATAHVGSNSMASNATANGVATAGCFIASPIGATQGIIETFSFLVPPFHFARVDYSNVTRAQTTFQNIPS